MFGVDAALLVILGAALWAGLILLCVGLAMSAALGDRNDERRRTLERRARIRDRIQNGES